MRSCIIVGMVLSLAVPVWADEASSPQPKKGIRVEELPKPIPELLDKIQQLSKKIEPEISRMGSTLGQELKVTVKKLCDELQCQERQESK